MARISGPTTAADIEIFSTEPYAKHRLGETVETQDGKRVVYYKAGAVAVSTGALLQSPALDTAYVGLTATASVNALSITVTNGASALTADQFAGGYLEVTAGAGLGQIFDIISHPAAAAAATCVMVVADTVATALAGSTVTLKLNPANGAIAHPTVATGTTLGVALSDVAAGEYGWAGTRGEFPVVSDALVAALGQTVVPSITTAGTVTLATLVTQKAVGTASQAGVAAAATGVSLSL